MNKDHIISEIVRTTEENNGKPLGTQRFERVTGIKKSYGVILRLPDSLSAA